MIQKNSDVEKALSYFRAEVKRIANDYIPDNQSLAPLALDEMREALQSLLTTDLERQDTEEQQKLAALGKLKVSDFANEHGLWAVRHSQGGRVALFYNRELALQMVTLFNESQKNSHIAT